MNSFQSTIYRGIPYKFKDFPLTVSALRKNELDYLKSCFIERYNVDKLNEYYTKLNFKCSIPFFKNIGHDCAWAWFLSLVHIMLEIKGNPTLISPLKNELFISVFENMSKTDVSLIPETAYKNTCDVFSPGYKDITSCAISNTTASNMVYGFEYFQHINYDLRGDLNYNPFPTMVMDWTEDIDIAKGFACPNNERGILLSINYDKYKLLLFKKWYPFLLDTIIASNLPGMTPYFDYHFYFSKTNKNMQNQKGIILFWPWNYTISNLLHNRLGRQLGFKVKEI